MKVGVVCPYDLGAPGGVQQLCFDLASNLIGEGDDAIVVGPGGKDMEIPAGLGDRVLTVGRSTPIRANRSVSPIALSPSSWMRTRDALDDVDVVHVHEPVMPLVGLAALGLEKPTVATFHADAPRWVNPFYRMVPVGKRMRGSIKTAVSEVAQRSIPDGWGDVRIVPNAVDVASFRSDLARVANRVCFLGRDEPRKGLDIALEAFSKIRQSHPDSELIVMSAYRREGPEGVTYLGWVTEEEKRRVLATSEVYIAPNTGGESFGIVLAEAMASGCAVVASDIDGFRAVLDEDGILVPVGDVEGFAGAISRLLTDRDERKRLSAAGRQAVSRFDWPTVFGQYRDAYDGAMSI